MISRNTCSNDFPDVPDQVQNYMDYSADGCMNTFTLCQRDRMHANLVKYRPKLVSKESLALSGCGTEIDSTIALGGIFAYPNPADRYLMVNVDIEGAGTSSVDLVDVAGRKVYSNPTALVGRGIFNLDLSSFLAGSYHLMVKNDKQYLHQTIIVVR